MQASTPDGCVCACGQPGSRAGHVPMLNCAHVPTHNCFGVSGGEDACALRVREFSLRSVGIDMRDVVRYRSDGTVVSLSSSFPSMYQGFGRVNLSSALPLPNSFLAPWLRMRVIDGESLTTGGTSSLCIRLMSATLPLKVTLVWTDPPAASMASVTLVNDLNLAVVDLADLSSLWYGNHPKSSRGAGPDFVNNVEQAQPRPISRSTIPVFE